LILLAGLLVTVGASILLVKTVEPTFSTHADYLLLVPSEPKANGTGGNPYLDLGLSVMAEVVVTGMTDERIAAAAAEISPTALYGVAGTQGNAPMVSIETIARTPEAALAVQKLLGKEVKSFLSSRQEEFGAPKGRIIKAVSITDPLTAQQSNSRVLRAVIAVTVVGIGSTVLLAFAFDAARRRRTTDPDPSIPPAAQKATSPAARSDEARVGVAW